MIKVSSAKKNIEATIALTPSKSISNRVRIIQALTEERISISNLSSSGDSLLLANALETLLPAINVKDAGTAFRFLTALLSIKEGKHTLTGSERMKKRPIGALVNALQSLGADIQYTGEVGYPPLQIIGRKLKGGHILINATESSQFISALLMIAPLINGGVRISFNGPISSRPYIEMTISLMKYFGAKVIWDSSGISVEEGTYNSVPIQIENDWSSASFWFAMAALADAAEIRMQNINFNSIQGDVIVSEIFKNFGVNSVQVDRDVILNKVLDFKLPDYFEYNFTSCPDLVIPVGFVCAALKIKAHFTGVKNLRIKESDRLTALKNEIIKLGASASIHNDSFTIDNFQKPADEIFFISYDDHRMVMAEAVTSVFFNQISIDNHVPVRKSYPEFWDHLRSSGFETSIT